MLFILGTVLLLVVLRDVFQSMIPRAMSTRLCMTPFLVHRIFWPSFSFVGSRISKPGLKADVLSLFVPFTVLGLLFTWICLFAISLALISLAFGSHFSPPVNTFLDALYVSFTALLTIGMAPDIAPKSDAAKFLILGGDLLGMLLIASVLSLMFGLIASIQTRERHVALITSLGGTPPSGSTILETFSRLSGDECLQTFFDECHHWCADVQETHTAYPILPYCRSNDPSSSWLTALGAILDASSLMLSVNPDKSCFSAKMTYLLGSKLIREVGAIFNMTASKQEEIDCDDFHQLYIRLQAAGYCSNSEEDAKRNFDLLRLEYFTAHRSLCDYLLVPRTPFTSETLSRLPNLATSQCLKPRR